MPTPDMQRLFTLERKIWQMRQTAFARWGADGKLRGRSAQDENNFHSSEATLFTLDNVMDEFREAIDGVSGRGWQQMAAQMKRVE